MTTEDVRVRLRTKLESTFGAEEASLLMDRPPGGWTDLVTTPVLEGRLDALRYELVGQMAELPGPDVAPGGHDLRGVWHVRHTRAHHLTDELVTTRRAACGVPTG
jgi:hypothetical protein